MKRIWIDAGHGGTQPGAVSGKRLEKNDVLCFALELERQFKQQGMETVMTRRTDVDVPLSVRTKLERANKCDLGISCHRNSAITMATGVEAWVHSREITSVVAWAADVVKGISALGTPLRPGMAAKGVYKGYRDNPSADYQINLETNSPTMLLELGFISNPADNQFFDAKLSEMCTAIVKASCKYLGVEYKEPDIEKPKEDVETKNMIYRVQVGAFGKLENAQNMKKNLESDGYQAIIMSTEQTQKPHIY